MEAVDPTTHLLMRIAASIGWAGLGVCILYAGLRFYDWLDPIDYRQEIEKGNVAAAIKLAAITLSLAALIVTAMLT